MTIKSFEYTQTDSIISIKNLKVEFDNFVLFNNFSIDFEKNSINVILGSSGSGKTTLLNILSSKIENKSFVFQEHRLLPNLNCYDNIDFVLQGVYKNKDERKKIIESNIESLGLKNSINLKPKHLSGGMRQRLSLARAFSYNSNFLLMDEPLQGLDIKRKKELIDIIKYKHLKEQNTIIYVVHDVSEALMLANNIFVLSASPNTEIIYSKKIDDDNRDITTEYMGSIQREIISCLLNSHVCVPRV